MTIRSKLHERESRFVDAFLGVAAGNATKAAIHAGIPPAGARVTAHRLLTRANVQRAIAARTRRREHVSLATAAERGELLTQIMRDPKIPTTTRIRAIAELNKCEGRHFVRKDVMTGGGLLLIEAITTSMRHRTLTSASAGLGPTAFLGGSSNRRT